MADQVLAAFLLEQQAGALALQQQDGGQQVLGISSSARLTTRADSCARAARAQQGRGQAVGFQRQAGGQGLGRGGDAMQPGDFHQAVQQRIIVGGAGVGAPFTGGLLR